MDGFSLTTSADGVDTIYIVPTQYCFVHRVERPAGINTEELDEFAELTLESLAPFPLDQLAWGYICGAEDSELLLYAAYKPRLNRDDLAPFPSAAYVLPVFASVYPLRIDSPTLFIIQYQQELTAVFAHPEKALPHRVESRAIEGDVNDPKHVFQTIEQWLPSLEVEKHYFIDHGLIRLEGAEMYADGSAGFIFSRREQPQSEPDMLPINHSSRADMLWQADMRDDTFIEAEIKRRNSAQRLWSTLKLAGIAALILLALQIGNLVANSLLSKQQDSIAQSASAVNHVKERHAMLITLKSFSTEALNPIAALATLDRYRPAEIWFQSLSGTSGNVMEIKGIAPSNSRLNAYTDALRKTRDFEYVNVPDFATRSGKVNFTMELKFTPTKTDETTPALTASSE